MHSKPQPRKYQWIILSGKHIQTESEKAYSTHKEPINLALDKAGIFYHTSGVAETQKIMEKPRRETYL